MCQDRRPPMAVAMQMVSQVTTIGGEMVLPAVAGHFLDKRWGIAPWLTIVGAVFGFLLSMWHLYQFAAELSRRNNQKPPKSKE